MQKWRTSKLPPSPSRVELLRNIRCSVTINIPVTQNIILFSEYVQHCVGAVCHCVRNTVNCFYWETKTIYAYYWHFRELTTKYQTLLDQATKEIQKLSRDKQNLEKEKKKLLATNVEMAKELTKIYMEQKEWRSTERGMRKANEEFAAEVAKLYAKEEALGEENDMLLKTITILGEEKVQQKEDLSEKIDALQASLKLLEEEKTQQNVVVKKLFSENVKHIAELVSQ